MNPPCPSVEQAYQRNSEKQNRNREATRVVAIFKNDLHKLVRKGTIRDAMNAMKTLVKNSGHWWRVTVVYLSLVSTYLPIYLAS